MAESHKTPAADPAYNPANPATRKTAVDNPASGKKADTISVIYNPGPGDPDSTEIFGQKVHAGEAFDLPAKYTDKVKGNPYLQMAGEKSYSVEHKAPEKQEEASFEENVARERAEEYLSGTPQFTSSAPGDAERVARAQETARELQEAVQSDDADKPRRGRPPKADK